MRREAIRTRRAGGVSARAGDGCRPRPLRRKHRSLSFYYHNGTTGRVYTYVKNLQGDIVAITNSAGTIVATYTYDAWGKLRASTDTDSLHIGTINPLRYRGYYYDTETGFYYLNSRYYNPTWGRFINADVISFLGANGIISYNLFTYCEDNPVVGYDPDGTVNIDNLLRGGGWLVTGISAIAVGVSVLTCGVAAPAMITVASLTIVAGVATTVNGVSELDEAVTGHNFMRDSVFRENSTAYNAYANSTAAVAQIGTTICGGWLAHNAPRINAYNNVQNYRYADGAAKHIGERSYYNSTLVQKQIIRYGCMTNEGNGVYTFRTAGTSFNVGKQTFQRGTWELTTINNKNLIGHFLLR